MSKGFEAKIGLNPKLIYETPKSLKSLDLKMLLLFSVIHKVENAYASVFPCEGFS